ncbi:MAG: universal stress protein [Chloroflexota bacterium]
MSTRPTTPLRILLATDDSPAARTGEQWIARLRWASAPIVDVVCVAGRGMARLGWGLATDRETLRQARDTIREGERIEAERIANEVGERLQNAGFTVHTLARQGDSAEQILATIESERPDLVVMGPRGRSALAQAILGSVTQQVIADGVDPVLVARVPESADGPLPSRILLVVDGSLDARAAIERLLDLGWTNGALVTVLGLLGERSSLGAGPAELSEEVQRTVREDATATIDHLIRPLVDAGVDVDVLLRDGQPLERTLDAASTLGVDVVVVTRSARRRGRDLFAEKVARHAPVSVLIVTAL